MLKVSYSHRKNVEKLQRDFAKFSRKNKDKYDSAADLRHAFLKGNAPGWVVTEAAKNLVPADFIDNKKDIQSVREGWRAVHALKAALRALAKLEEHPGIANFFGGGCMAGFGWGLVFRELNNLCEIAVYIDERVDLNDYCSALMVFSDMIVSGFECITPGREDFWDDFVYRICEGDVPIYPVPDYIKAREKQQ